MIIPTASRAVASGSPANARTQAMPNAWHRRRDARFPATSIRASPSDSSGAGAQIGLTEPTEHRSTVADRQVIAHAEALLPRPRRVAARRSPYARLGCGGTFRAMKVSPRVRWAIHLALAALGLAGIGLLVRHAGIPALVSTLREAGPLLPVALALEGGRVAADTWRTSLLYARAGVHVPFRRLFSLQLSSYPLNLLIPAGGAASEAFKAAALSEEVGGALGAAVATTNQALVLFGGFIVSIPCTAVALSVWGPRSGFTIAIATQALTALGLGAFIQLASRRRLVGELVRRVSGRAGDAMGSYRDAVVVLTSLPLDALGAAALGKALQLGVLGVLANYD